MFRTVFILVMFCTLTACVTPMRLGISEAEWQNYSPEEREKIKSGYYQMLKTHVDTQEKVVPDGSQVHVKVSDGQVMFPPFASPSNYLPAEFDIQSGDCQTVKLEDQRRDKNVSMKVCYINKTLYLDPSRYDPSKKVGSIQLHYSPIWDRGFTYRKVSSSGYVHLTDVNVAVRKYDFDEQNESPN